MKPHLREKLLSLREKGLQVKERTLEAKALELEIQKRELAVARREEEAKRRGSMAAGAEIDGRNSNNDDHQISPELLADITEAVKLLLKEVQHTSTERHRVQSHLVFRVKSGNPNANMYHRKGRSGVCEEAGGEVLQRRYFSARMLLAIASK